MIKIVRLDLYGTPCRVPVYRVHMICKNHLAQIEYCVMLQFAYNGDFNLDAESLRT